MTDFFPLHCIGVSDKKTNKPETKAKIIIIITILIVLYTIHLATLSAHKESEEASSNGR